MAQTVQFKLGGTLVFSSEEEGYVLVTVRYGNFTLTAKGDKMAYSLPVMHSVGVKVSYVDAHGNPATVDGDVTWASSDASIAQVTADAADSTQATITSGSSVGQAQVTATADADLGTGVRELITLLDVTVLAGEAVAGTIEPVGPSSPV